MALLASGEWFMIHHTAIRRCRFFIVGESVMYISIGLLGYSSIRTPRRTPQLLSTELFWCFANIQKIKKFAECVISLQWTNLRFILQSSFVSLAGI